MRGGEMTSSSRIMLSSLHVSDITEEYLETLNDKEYLRYSRNSSFDHTIESQTRYISEFNLSNNLLFGIKSKTDMKLLGSVSCYIDFTKLTLNLGFLIFKNYQGRGFASEALGLLIRHLEGQFPGMTAIIGSEPNNFAMHEVAKKHDFQILNKDTEDEHVIYARTLRRLDDTSLPGVPSYVLCARSIGVVAFDAGGAEQISWLLRNIPQKVIAYIEGPAERIFNNLEVAFDKADELNDIFECDLVITGSGWMSQLEITAIQQAKLRNIPCLTVLDHWMNYLERFGTDDSTQPNTLAVTNPVALQLAQEKFPNSVIYLLPDFQIESYRITLGARKQEPKQGLIVLDPISTLVPNFTIDRNKIVNLIESAIRIKQHQGLTSLILRPHPSQIIDPLLTQILDHFSEEIVLSNSPSLLQDLAVSKMVIGFNSYALYISSQCEITTYSYFAGEIGHWSHFFSNILEIEF